MACSSASTMLRTETGNQLFARLGNRPSVADLEPSLFSSISAGDVVEISGQAKSGKTEMLYHFIARCIFPFSWNYLHLDGFNAGVIFIDNDYHFNLFRLLTILENRIIAAKMNASEKISLSTNEISAFIKERLKLLFVVKCSNSEQLIVTLYSLETLLGSNNHISVMMIDSVSAYYWLDRMNMMDQLKKLDDYYMKLIDVLKKLGQNYCLTIFATKQHLMKNAELSSEKRGTSSNSSDYEFMGRHWQKFVTCRLGLNWNCAEEHRTFITVCKIRDGRKEMKSCMITDSGICFY